MNRTVLIGRLTRDPELKYTSNNTAVATFTLAVNRPFQGQDGVQQADFINIVVWRKLAENIKKYITQGSQIAVEGRIQTRNYDGEDGKKRYITEVVADNVHFLDTKKSREQRNNNESDDNVHDMNTNSPTSKTPYDFPNQSPVETNVSNEPFANFGASIEISDEELPF